MSDETRVLATAEGKVKAPLLHKGKVRELYDLGDAMLIVVTDRISAFDYVLEPPIPEKGRVLNQLARFWFEQIGGWMEHHMLHTDVEQIKDVLTDPGLFSERVMVVKKAKRIDVECVVRGYITGGGWRQYEKTGTVNGHRLPPGLRKNEKLDRPLFTPALKNDVGHDEDISVEELERKVGKALARELEEKSMRLYEFASHFCAQRGIILADCKFEFGIVEDRVIVIDEIFTPDSSRFWAREDYRLDTDIDSMDKEPVRNYLAASGWDRNSPPAPLPEQIVVETTKRYLQIYERLTGAKS